MLNNIELKDFKSLTKETLTFGPLTIITGMNSSGKSTVIQAILLSIRYAQLENKYKMEPLTKYLDDFKQIRNKNNNAKKIRINIISDEGKYELCITDEGIETEGELSFGIDLPSKNLSPELFYLTANRQGPEEISATSSSKIGASGQYIFGYFDSVKDKALSKALCRFKESRTLAYQVSRWLSQVTDTKTELKTENLSSSQVQVYFEDATLGQVSPFNLGAGMSYVAKVIILCLVAKKGDLVIIENPEIHLHPKAQAALGVFFSFIANSGIQLIVETHCEHLINKVRHQVFEKALEKHQVVIHYKAHIEREFQQLFLNGNGHYIDQNNDLVSFPQGFFDGTLNELIEIGG
ncbi:AAA family ATPase [Aliivibrio fischeri]|uniref:AAA family ATPase n=1 Tax=Aliivibrio fischeri TaxID=668 RepID=UPI001F38689E|nr:AAA family ATPase [Aliivibrio fischeri]MCE7566222.1 AAA family ATPase [Aliivibrio fischeri]